MAALMADRVTDYKGTRTTRKASGEVHIGPAPGVHTADLPSFIVDLAVENLQRIGRLGPEMSTNDIVVLTGCRFEPWGPDTPEALHSASRIRAVQDTTFFAEDLLEAIHAFHHPDAPTEESTRWASERSASVENDEKAAANANARPALALYTAIRDCAIVRFVAVHSVYFSSDSPAALTCLVDQIEGPDETGPVTRTPARIGLPTRERERKDNPYVAFVRTPDHGIGAIVRAALEELSILAKGGDADADTDYRRVIVSLATALNLFGLPKEHGGVLLRWDAIHTLGYAIDLLPSEADRPQLMALISFLSLATDEATLPL